MPAQLPPVPKELQLPAGPYAVLRAAIDDDAYGICDWEGRTITVRPTLRRTAAWLTLRHEWVHAVLYDAGVHGLSDEAEEAVCNAIAQALVFEMRHP